MAYRRTATSPVLDEADAGVPIPAPYNMGNLPFILEMNPEAMRERYVGRHKNTRTDGGNVPDPTRNRTSSILEIYKNALVRNPLSWLFATIGSIVHRISSCRINHSHSLTAMR